MAARASLPMRADPVGAGGFSLLELLVALAVFSLAVLALLNLGGESARAAAIAEERLLADIVAENLAVEAAVLPLETLQSRPEGEDIQGERRWHWQRQVVPTGEELLRIDIGVRGTASSQLLAERQVLRGAS